MPNSSAIAVVEVGKPLAHIPAPIGADVTIAPHEVLIKVSVVGLAPLDTKIRDRNPFKLPLPFIPGGDLVGIVERCGADISLPIGSHIFVQQGFKSDRGGLQEYTIVDGRYAAIVPPMISDEEAALYPINAVTAAKSLFTVDGLGWPFPGTIPSASYDYTAHHVVIVGGGTNISKLVCQFAKLAGVGTIVAIASKSSETELREFGATHVIDRHGSERDIKRQVEAVVQGDVINVLDTHGNLDLSVSLLSNTRRGTLIHLTHGIVSEEVALRKNGGFDQRHIQGFSGSIPEFGRTFWKAFPDWLETRKVKPLKFKIIDGLNIAQINAALDVYAAGKGGTRSHVKLV